jgi:hypothetical protein
MGLRRFSFQLPSGLMASNAQAFRDELKKKNKSLGKSEALNPKTMIEMNRTSVSVIWGCWTEV